MRIPLGLPNGLKRKSNMTLKKTGHVFNLFISPSAYWAHRIDPLHTWPPPDPDRMPRRFEPIDIPAGGAKGAFTIGGQYTSGADEIEAFRRRQQADIQRRAAPAAGFQRRRPFRERYVKMQKQAGESEGGLVGQDEYEYEYDSVNDDNEHDGNEEEGDGEEGWRDAEGDRLGDFGVDEEVEFYDEDDIPLSRLIEHRRSQARRADM